MISYFQFGFQFENDNIKIYQNINPNGGLVFSSMDEVAECALDMSKFYPEILNESIQWFKNNDLDIPTLFKVYILDDLKKEKIEYIKKAKQQAQDIGVLYKDHHFQMDADGKANILGIRIAIQDGSYTTFPIAFKTYENEYVQLSKDEYIEMSNAALNFVYKCLAQKEKLVQEIEAAETPEDLDKIEWVFE